MADPLFDLTGRRVWVAGHRGMVGSALVRRLEVEDCTLITVDRSVLDLRRQADVSAFVAAQRPEVVFLAAAKVGGILANSTQPGDFILENLSIQTNVIEAAWRHGVRKLVFLGSSCIYPRMSPQPIEETALLTGPLEPTNQAYAVAKIAGLTLCQMLRRQYGADFIAVMPTNLYGRGDNYDLSAGHMLPALIRKAHEAKVSGAEAITLWGTGSPRREFMHVDDCADAIIHVTTTYSAPEPINIGVGDDIALIDLARMICGIVGFTGRIGHDLSKPDGTPRKLLCVDRLRALGWSPQIALRQGIAETYAAFLETPVAAG
ncbi:MAG: GDP-L-fucose synthase family protein [Labrys sp. (in: a-proteobacteria)]